MKIIHVVESFGGGVYEFLKLLTKNDKKNEHIIIYELRPETPENFEKEFEHVKLINIKMQREINIIKDFLSCIKLYTLLNKLEVDILHLHSSKAGLYGRTINVFKIKKYKIIYNPHGLSFLQANESTLKRLMLLLVEKILCILSPGKIVGVSEQEYQVIKDKLSKKQAVNINNGINSLIDISLDLSEKSIDFITIGRICEQKNPTMFNEFALKYPDKKFVWIGDGELRDKLTAPNIVVTGWISNKNKINEFLINSKVYLQLSLWEGLPISLLEAMRVGLPCIVTDCVGLKEIIIKSNNGGIVDYNLSEVSNIIEKIKKNYINYSSNSKEAITNFYSVEKMTKSYMTLYTNYNR